MTTAQRSQASKDAVAGPSSSGHTMRKTITGPDRSETGNDEAPIAARISRRRHNSGCGINSTGERPFRDVFRQHEDDAVHGQYGSVHVERDVEGREHNALQAQQRDGDIRRP